MVKKLGKKISADLVAQKAETITREMYFGGDGRSFYEDL